MLLARGRGTVTQMGDLAPYSCLCIYENESFLRNEPFFSRYMLRADNNLAGH